MAQPTDEALLRWTAAAQHLWLFLDYDGTLADFSRTPNLVEVKDEVVGLVRTLAAHPRLRVAIVSGRTLSIVRQLLPVEGVYLAGVYGLEILSPEGVLIQRENLGRVRPVLDKIKPRWEKLLSGQAGFFLEDKGWSLAIHADKAEHELAQRVLASARRAAETDLPKDHFRWFEDELFLEVAPMQAHKGKAVGYLYGHFPLHQARLVYIGDDDKDEEAFGTVHAFGGVNILVSSQPRPFHVDEVDYLLETPEAVRHWLEQLLNCL